MRAETYEEAGYWEARADYLEHELKRALARIDALESTVEDLNRGARAEAGAAGRAQPRRGCYECGWACWRTSPPSSRP